MLLSGVLAATKFRTGMIGTKLAIGLFCTIVVPVFAVWSFSIVTRLALLGFLGLEGFYPETTRNDRDLSAWPASPEKLIE
jgi:hypothetical protein